MWNRDPENPFERQHGDGYARQEKRKTSEDRMRLSSRLR
jgi:hypothetical protein